MPFQIPDHELKTLLDEANVAKTGLDLADARKLLPHVPARTVQRRLALLVRDGRLIAHGMGTARRFVAPATQPSAATKSTEIPTSVLPLSAEGAELLKRAIRPLVLRKPVGYQRDFLDRYIPNKTQCLETKLRLRVHEMGRSPIGEMPAGT